MVKRESKLQYILKKSALYYYPIFVSQVNDTTYSVTMRLVSPIISILLKAKQASDLRYYIIVR